MKTRLSISRFWLVIVVCAASLFSYANAFARDGDRDRGGSYHRREVVVVGPHRYYYDDGRFYRPGWFGLQFYLSVPPIGAVVTSLPLGYRTIVVRGVPYYYYDNVYYRTNPSGYIVVPSSDLYSQPAAVVPYQGGNRQTITINVPNRSGGFTPVTLVRQGDGYVGPQGEYYPGNPTVEQLRALYGN